MSISLASKYSSFGSWAVIANILSNLGNAIRWSQFCKNNLHSASVQKFDQNLPIAIFKNLLSCRFSSRSFQFVIWRHHSANTLSNPEPQSRGSGFCNWEQYVLVSGSYFYSHLLIAGPLFLDFLSSVCISYWVRSLHFSPNLHFVPNLQFMFYTDHNRCSVFDERNVMKVKGR